MPEDTGNVLEDQQATGTEPVEPDLDTEPTEEPEEAEESQRPTGRRDARRATRAAASKHSPKIASDESDTDDGAEDDGAAAPDAEAAAEGEAVEEEEEGKPQEQEKEAPKPIPVPIPQGHAIRGMGRDKIMAATPEDERAIRALLNGSYHRRQEVEALQQQLMEREEQITRLEANQAAVSKWEGSKDYQEALNRYKALRELEEEERVPAGTALEFWRGAELKRQQLAESEFKERMETVQTQRAERAAQQFAKAAYENVSTNIPPALRDLPEYNQWFRQALESFDSEFRLGHFPTVQTPDDLHQEFRRFFSASLLRQPKAMETFKRIRAENEQKQKEAAAAAAAKDRERAALKEQGVNEFKKSAAEKRRANPPHPLGNLGASRSRAPSAEASDDAESLTGKSAHQIRRMAREKSREKAGEHFTRR